MSDDRGAVYVNEAGRPIYRASGLYSCTSILVGLRLGLQGSPPPDWMQQRFDEGHNLEAEVLERARTRGMAIANFQAEVRQNIGPATIVGHIDALGYPQDLGICINSLDFATCPPDKSLTFIEPVLVIDAKAFAQSTWDEWVRGIEKGDVWDRFPYYAWQQEIYAKAHGDIPVAMAIALKDRSDESDVKIVDFRLDVFTKPLVPYGRIVAKVLEVERLAAMGMEGLPDKCDLKTYPCTFWSFPFHTDTKKTDVELGDDDVEGGLPALAELADRRLDAYRRQKEAEAEIAAIDTDIVRITGEKTGSAKIASFSSGVSSVSLYHHGYSTVDWAQLIRDHPAVEKNKYQKDQKSQKVTVKLNPKRKSAPVNVEALIQ